MIERLSTKSLFVLLAAFILILFAFGMSAQFSTAKSLAVQSSEIGFVSLSPAGEKGGVIVPASEESTPTCEELGNCPAVVTTCEQRGDCPAVVTTCEQRGDCPAVVTTCEQRGDCPAVVTTCEQRGDCPSTPSGCGPGTLNDRCITSGTSGGGVVVDNPQKTPSPPPVEENTPTGAGGGSNDEDSSPPPPIYVNSPLRAAPSWLRRGERATVAWNISNAQSCTVTGDNGDGTGYNSTGIWSGLNSATPGGIGKTSSGITGLTIFTLNCRALPGASPSSHRESVTVRVIPVSSEPRLY